MTRNHGTKQKASPIKEGWAVAIKVLRLLFHSVLSVATVFIVMLYLMSAFSDHVDPRQFKYIAFLGIGYHLALIAMLLWGIAMLVLRRWILASIIGITLIISHEQIRRYFPLNIFSPSVDVAQGADTIKLLTFNTCISGQAHLSKIKEKLKVIDLVKTSDADIVCLQEYAFSLSKNGHTQEEMKKSLSKIYPYYHFLPNSGKKAMGIALFSKYPIKKTKRIDERKSGYVSSMYYELDANGKTIALVNNHLQSNNIAVEDRELYNDIIEKLEADSAQIERFKTGMLRNLGKAYISRAQQSNLIKSTVDEQQEIQKHPLLICGDMNDTPISYCYRTMRGDLADTWQEIGLGAGTTFNKYHLWFRIDHVFHSEELIPLEARVMDEVDYSDHYPLMATFILNN